MCALYVYFFIELIVYVVIFVAFMSLGIFNVLFFA